MAASSYWVVALDVVRDVRDIEEDYTGGERADLEPKRAGRPF